MSIFLLIGGVALVVLAATIAVIAVLTPLKSPQPGVDRPYGVDQAGS